MKGMILSKQFDYIGRRARKEKSDWKAGVHTPRLASVKGATPEKVEKRSSDRGMESRQYNKFPIQRRYLGACPEVFHFLDKHPGREQQERTS